ncbi:LysR family transcriptional regulator [Cupriavidus necator]|uniref:LysR family transcriptional regulator n=1 Tax=Cupriavidus necator TaxID=106590 RepID=UPI003F739E0F
MTLVQLEAFIRAARLGTFSAAAAEMGISQPGVSDLVGRLEAELSTKLFYRANKQLVLTVAGEQLLPFAEQSTVSAEQGERAVKAMMSLGGGTATFGLLRNADFYLSTNLAKQFHALYPNVRIRLIGQNSAETATDVASGYLEAGLVTLPVDDTDLDVVPLVRDEVCFVSADTEHCAKPVSIQDLSEARLVFYDAHYADTDPARRQIIDRARVAGIRISPMIEVEYLTSALALVSEGIGDTIACRAAIASDRFPPSLFHVSFKDPLYDTLALVKRRGQLLSPATREMARLAHDALMAYQRSAKGTAEILPTASATDSFFF